jgi:predicted TIM-barrel fold metal-dependent hydrolase
MGSDFSLTKQKIIDVRNRPTFLHPFYGKDAQSSESQVVRWLGARVGARDVEHFASHGSMQSYLKALDEAGISLAVVTGRSTPAVRIENVEVQRIVGQAPDRLIGIGAIDPELTGITRAVEEIHQAKSEMGLKGINLDPAFLTRPLQADDAMLYPLYEEAQRLELPVFLMTGPTSPDLRYAHPATIGRVANEFPRLKIVVSHGGYPFVD